jgi:hypothetical protein
MARTNDSAADARIRDLTQRFLARDFEPPAQPEGQTVPPEVKAQFVGLYRASTLRNERTRWLSRLTDLFRLSIDQERIVLSPPRAPDIRYVAVRNGLARQANAPITSLALLGTIEGETRVETVEYGNLVKVSAVSVYLERAAMIASVLLVISAVAFALVWVPRWALGRLSDRSGLAARAWPALTAFLLMAPIALTFIGGALGQVDFSTDRPSVYEVGYAIGTIAFFLAACISLYVIWRLRKASIHRGTYWHSVAVVAANAWIAGYLLYWGRIGIGI